MFLLPRRAEALLPPFALLAMAAAWGSTFFLLKDLTTRVPVPDLLAVRFGVAAVVMALVGHRRWRLDRPVLLGGLLLGVLYGGAQLVQTVGLTRTAASVSGFITGLYVVATPLLAAVVLRVRATRLTWAAVALATAGLAVLSLHGFSVGTGELLTLVSAVVYAAHILATDRVSRADRVLGLAFVQTVVIAAVCWVAALPDGVVLPRGAADWGAVLYLAVIAGALAIFLQTWAQARISATRSAVIMSMEPVWAAFFAVLAGGERLSVRMVVGGLSIVGAMYLVEVGPWLARRRARARVAAELPAPAGPTAGEENL